MNNGLNGLERPDVQGGSPLVHPADLGLHHTFIESRPFTQKPDPMLFGVMSTGNFQGNSPPDQHFLTRPLSFVSGEHGFIHLPHTVQPTLSQASNSATAVLRPPVNPGGVKIFAQNVVIEPKVNHFTIEASKHPLDSVNMAISNADASHVLYSMNKLIYKLFPYLKSKYETHHAYQPNSTTSQNQPDAVDVSVSTDNVVTQSKDHTMESNHAEEFRPLLSSVTLDTSGDRPADIITSVTETRQI